MKSVKFRMIAIALLSATMPFTAKAQDKVEASVGADFVSNYIWRVFHLLNLFSNCHVCPFYSF